MKTCKTCKHSKTNLLLGGEYATCKRPGLLYTSLVTGKKRIEVRYCDIERKYTEFCGPDGKYWETK